MGLAKERDIQAKLRADAQAERKKRTDALKAERDARKAALAAERELNRAKVKGLTEQIATLKAKLAEKLAKAEPAPEAADAAAEERDRLAAELEEKSKSLADAQKRAETATEEADKDARQRIKEIGDRMIGPAAMAWFYACKALEAVQNLEDLAQLQHEFFEQKFLAEVDRVVARLQEIKAIAQRSRKTGRWGR